MSDLKMQFLQKAEIELTKQLDGNVSMVVDILARILADYDLQQASTEIVPYSRINETLLNNYCGCLLIGGKSEKTIKQYRRTAEKLAAFTNKTYLDIGVYDIRMFLGSERQRGVSGRTVENTRANLSAFFQWLHKEDHIAKNPCMNIAPIKYADKVRLPFSVVELDAIRFACRTTKERAIVEMLLATGIRVSELAGLRVVDINVHDMSVHVIKGKGAKERTVYMNDLARTHLQAYLAERDVVEQHLFLNKQKEPLNPGGIRHILKEIGKRAGVDNVHPHRFRRRFATGLANRGMEIQEIKMLLGHSDINTTLEYVYTSDEKAHASYMKYSA